MRIISGTRKNMCFSFIWYYFEIDKTIVDNYLNILQFIYKIPLPFLPPDIGRAEKYFISTSKVYFSNIINLFICIKTIGSHWNGP